jgi:hypothetical protein
MRTLGAVVAVMVLGCGAGGSDGWHQAGECDPPAGTDVTAAATTTIYDRSDVAAGCFDAFTSLRVIHSQAEWDTQFSPATCADPPPVPAGLDFATQEAAVIAFDCTPFDHTFTVETADELVIGVYAHVSGACLGNVDVVPLPRSSKTVRLAECHDECSDCPPVP